MVDYAVPSAIAVPTNSTADSPALMADGVPYPPYTSKAKPGRTE